jgi:hypothetical protein
LSTTSVSTFSSRSSASALRIRTPAAAPRPTPTMIDMGVARPERAGAGDDQHRNRRHQRIGEGGVEGPQIDQAAKQRSQTTASPRHEPACDDLSARRWMGARLRWASATI